MKNSTSAPNRYVLHTTSHGAGWTSWHDGPVEQKRYMLEYAPFVEAVRAREALLKEAPLKVSCAPAPCRKFKALVVREAAGGIGLYFDGTCATILTELRKKKAKGSPRLELLGTIEAEVPVYLPVERFLRDWVVEYGVEQCPPYLGGLAHIAIEEVPAGYQVKVTEDEGWETVISRDPESSYWM